MRIFKSKRSLSLVAITSLLIPLLVTSGTARAADPACATANYVTSCVGATSDSAPYSMMVPANFNGTVFIYSHGYRPNIPVPAGIPGYGGYTVTNTPQPGPNATVIGALLAKGYGVMGSGFSRQGWNANEGVKTDVELIGLFKKQFTKTKKVIAWGESLGGFITQALAESNGSLLSAAAPMCMASNISPLSTMAGDALWGMKTFFDPTIKGGNYSAGAAGYAEAMGDLVKVFTAIGALQAAFAANPKLPAWPATSKVPDAMKAAIPSRSALVLVALMSGVPLQSAHFDSTSAPSVLSAADQTSFQIAINPAFAALENVATAAALAVLVTYDLELQSGGAFFDNTKTNYTARLGDDAFVWTSALSGKTATDTLLGYLAAAPRATGNAAAMAKMKAQLAHTGKITVPTITLVGTADPVTVAGNSQWIADRYAEQYAQALVDARASYKQTGSYKRPDSKLLSIWNFPAAKYTKYTALGAPDTTVPAASGTNHCNFTDSQYLAVADLLAYASENGTHLAGGALYTKLRKAGGMTIDKEYRAPLLKAYGDN